jgi:predicted transcriptional regulator
MADETSPGMINLTASLVAALVQKGTVAAADLPDLIRATYSALAGTEATELESAEHQQPAVTIKKSVRPDAIVCLECGRHQKTIKRHLSTAHDLSVAEYRAKWSLPADYPMVAPEYAAHRSQLAVQIGLGHSRKKPKVTPAPKTTEPAEAKPGHRYPASRWSRPTG